MNVWVVEIDYGGMFWQPVAYCFSEKQAENLATAPHILKVNKPVRINKKEIK